MDKITKEDDSSQMEREITSPLSVKRPRVDCTVTNNHSGRSQFSFPELLTFREANSSPSSASRLQKNEGLICTAQCLDFQHEELQCQPQDIKFNGIPTTEVTSYSTRTNRGSSEVCLITAESHLLSLWKYEQPPITETDKLSLYPGDYTGGFFEESTASASAHTSSQPNGRLLGTPLKDETPSGCILSTGKDEDGRQMQKDDSEIQAVTLRSRNEEVRCQPDCTCTDTVHDVGFCNTRSQFAEVVETNQKRAEVEFNENILFTKEKSKSLKSSSDYADSKPLYSNPEEDPSGNLTEGEEKEEDGLELQFCENENVSACDAETEGQVNENGMSKTFIPSAAVSGERSIPSHGAVLERNTAIENMSLRVDDFCGAKREDAAGKIIAKAWRETADHTTETTMLGRISQEPAEGDNDAGPFSVIDPAICSETDREAEGNRCNSVSAAGAKLSPSEEVCEMETLLPLCSDIRPSQKVSSPEQTKQFIHQSTPYWEGENDEFCQSEAQPCFIITNEMHGRTFSERICQLKSSPSRSPANSLPPGHDGRQECLGTMGHELKEQSQASYFPVSLDHLKTQEVEQLQREIGSLDEKAEIKERDEILSFVRELESSEGRDLEKMIELEEQPFLLNEQHEGDTAETSAAHCTADWTEGETQKRSSDVPLTEDEQGSKLECLSDQPFSAVISMTDVEEEEMTKVRVEMKTDGPEILVQSEYYLQQQNEHKAEVSSGEGVSEWTERSKLALGSEDGQEHKLSCLSDCQDKAENKADYLTFTFSSASDAVVPCQGNLSHSQKAHNSPTAMNCSDRFSPLPSAFTLYNCVLEGFDTFEKIQLSPDDDDDDDDDDAAGVSNSPMLTSLSGQQLKPPEWQLHHCMSVAESDSHEELSEEEKEEEEVEGFECRTENIANGFLSSDSACNELPNFISAADVIALGWPEQQPNCESACDSYEHIQDQFHPELVSSAISTESDNPASDASDSAEFEMKKQFDLVLKELNLFFEICRNDFEGYCRPTSPKNCSDITEALEGHASECVEPKVEHHRDTPSDDVDEDGSMDMCVSNPAVPHTAVSGDGEQEVPLSRHLCQEAAMETAEKHREPWEREQKGKMWSPSFISLPLCLLEQLGHGPLEQPRRLEPLKTCARPIRVGLSKRAKTKQLHRPHPYK